MAQTAIKELIYSALREMGLNEEPELRIDIPKQKKFGEYACNVAIQLAHKLSREPMELAGELVKALQKSDKSGKLKKTEAARPGFINFTLSDTYLRENLKIIHERDHDYGKREAQNGERVLLEFVSANPTGPLHIGHGRWAVIGDVIARLLSADGCRVDKEFYVNNVGNQVEKLEASVRAARAGKEIPEGGYGGAYIKDVKGERREEMLEALLSEQKEILNELGVAYDRWFYESELHKNDLVALAVKRLHHLGVTFEEGGAIWFKSQEFGDDKNRVLIREDGNPTYFAADIAYHLNKFERGYDRLIDIWGTDHHGYVGRLRAALGSLGEPVDKFEIIIGQLVTLYRGSEPIRMSKRTGEMITLKEVIDEIGRDATRFFFSATDVNSHLDFDLELAKKRSADNPVYYLQYAHARICSILKKSQTPNPKSQHGIDLSGLNHEAERELMVKLLRWPDVVKESARLRHPHRVTVYGKELAAAFHSFYEQCRVLGDPARLYLTDASRITLRNVLELLGISAPESM